MILHFSRKNILLKLSKRPVKKMCNCLPNGSFLVNQLVFIQIYTYYSEFIESFVKNMLLFK